MKNYIQKGGAVKVTLSENRQSGDLLFLGKVAAFLVSSGKTGEQVEAATDGVFSVQKEDQDYVFSVGQKVWSTPENEATIHQTANFLGVCWSGSTANDEQVEVKISPFSSPQFEGVVFVETKTDLPEPIPFLYGDDEIECNAHPLEEGKTYIFTQFVDLEGGVIKYDQCCILGLNSETTGILSTGKPANVPLIFGEGDLPMQNIDINADWAVEIDGTNKVTALDWKGVNFSDCPKVGVVKNATNFVYESSAFLNSKGLEFDGSIGTIAFDTCLFSGDGLSGAMLKILSTCTITRRFRCQFSSFIAANDTKAVDFSTSATVPNDQYILFRNNFSGGGTYLAGVEYSDNKSDFTDNKGISNSASIAEYSMTNNATATSIANTTDYYKISGTTIADAITQRFEHANNRMTYKGAVTGVFKVTAILSLNSGNNNQIYARIGKNGATISPSQNTTTTNGSGRAENIILQKSLSLSGLVDDFVEVFVRNSSANTSITVTEISVIIEKLS